MKVIPKYLVGDMVIITGLKTLDFLKLCGHNDWQRKVPRAINQTNTETNTDQSGENKLIRYRLNGLWFSQDELELVNKKTHPEYFL